jgi:F-type H+-transporting ATPase subunit delta
MKKSLNTLADEVIDVINEKNVKELSRAVWFELIHQKRLSGIDKLFELLEEKQSKQQGKLKATAISAQDLTDLQLQLLKEKIEEKYNSKVDILGKVNPQLLGGFQIKIGDEITDYSYKGKIQGLRQKMGVLNG